ncbi:MAG: hypothetical protein J6O56_04690 [Bacilli bacterium]|nr:hypothetical protein [Bacilli bacterium]
MTKERINEQERLRRIEMVGNYFLETGKPTREISRYFSDNYFEISNKTVYSYIKKYQELHKDKKDDINKLIDNNTEKSIEDPEVRERIFKVARLVLEGYTKEEISEILNISVKIVERDINPRLEMLSEHDEDLKIYYDAVINSLNAHQINALNENRNSHLKK